MKHLLAMCLLAANLLAASLAAVPARAQDTPSPEALRAAQDLAAIMNRDTVAQMTGALTNQMWPHVESQFAGKVDAATLAELRTEFETTLMSFTAEMVKDSPAIYARYFKVQELSELIAFYKSPTGAKSLQIMPRVMADVASQMGPRVQNFQRDLNARVEAVMQKHGYKK